MADDVEITEGVGTDIATDEVGGRHFQRVQTGQLRRRQVSALVTAAASSYATGDAVGAALELTNFGRAPFQSGVIEQVIVALDDPASGASVAVQFFDSAAPTVAGNADPFEPTFAELGTYLGSTYLGSPTRIGANRQWWDFAANYDLALDMPYLLTGTSMWAVVVATGTFGPIASANKWKLGVTARLD